MDINEAEKTLIFKCLAGSRLYGLNTETSDYDYRGVFTIDPASFWDLKRTIEQVENEKNDTVYYTLHRFFQLATAGNPNVLELIFAPTDSLSITSDIWEQIWKIRHLFISKDCLSPFAGYAVGQIKKARGQNKLINNPVSEAKPTKEDFCWIISMGIEEEFGYNAYDGQYTYPYIHSDLKEGEMPFRPKPLKGHNDILLDNCIAAAVEHVHNMYRLYEYPNATGGVFRGDSENLVLSSVPISHERQYFAGIMIYNKEAYESALRQWHQYWGWKANRNEARWVDQENKKLNYDSKNLMHCMRLIYSAKNIIENGEPLVRPEGEVKQRLMDIRHGKLAYEEILEEAEEGIAFIDSAKLASSLPDKPAYDQINTLVINLHKELLK
jgi:predicted nucleotidyltransferase